MFYFLSSKECLLKTQRAFCLMILMLFSHWAYSIGIKGNLKLFQEASISTEHGWYGTQVGWVQPSPFFLEKVTASLPLPVSSSPMEPQFPCTDLLDNEPVPSWLSSLHSPMTLLSCVSCIFQLNNFIRVVVSHAYRNSNEDSKTSKMFVHSRVERKSGQLPPSDGL